MAGLMELIMSDWMFVWLAVIVVTIIIEIITVGLTSIWLAGGALAALIVCLCGGHWGLQVGVFFVVTFVLLYFTRPWAKRYLESRKTATNYEETLGKKVRIIEAVDNHIIQARHCTTEWNGRQEQKTTAKHLHWMSRRWSLRYGGSR